VRRLSLHRRPAALVAVVVIILLTTAVVVVGPDALSDPAPARSAPRVLSATTVGLVVTADDCAAGWRARRAGPVVFGIEDRTGHGGEIYLFNPYSGVTVAQKALDPQATVRLPVHLRTGRYRWSCRLKGLPGRTSSVVTVGPAPILGGPAGPTFYVQVTANQMAAPLGAYRAYVEQELTLESTQIQLLAAAIAGGQIAAARSAWLTAHLSWHRIGGAYDAFGALGTSIDGTADRLQAGTASPQFTGFHKVEMDLWQNDSLTAAAADTTTLLTDVNELALKFPKERIPATELPLRTHEILEDALRDELSGEDDYGSGTDMASVEADVDGTRELLSLLAPLLRPRAPDLMSTVNTQLDALDAALSAARVDGRWVPVDEVPLAQREQVDGAIGAALETLALTPWLLHVVGSTT
jgi:high-affinity iron transporter